MIQCGTSQQFTFLSNDDDESETYLIAARTRCDQYDTGKLQHSSHDERRAQDSNADRWVQGRRNRLGFRLRPASPLRHVALRHCLVRRLYFISTFPDNRIHFSSPQIRRSRAIRAMSPGELIARSSLLSAQPPSLSLSLLTIARNCNRESQEAGQVPIRLCSSAGGRYVARRI